METEDFIQFVNRSPTAYHAAAEIAARLEKAGFTRLKESDRWKLEPGKGYFTSSQDACIAAFRTPKSTPASTVLLASHIDSPCLKLKPHPELSSHGIGQFGTEVYGGPLLHTWLDRELILAGQAVGLDAHGKIHSKTIRMDDHPVIIPGLAIHLDRTINEKGLLLNRQDHLKPIFTLHSTEKSLQEKLCKQLSFEKLLNFDLFLIPAEKASLVGFEKEFIASHRLDNLTSAYASLHALLHAAISLETLQMAIFWDHEEIGSVSSTGADSSLANQWLERISFSLKMDREDFFRMKARSLCISSDLAHGYNPNYAEKYDAQNSPFLSKGVVLKFNAGQKYATNSFTAAPIIKLAEKHKIPYQKFASRSDIPSGSTVGSMMAANLGMPTIDLGIAGWAMHSTREVIAAQDQIALNSLLKYALESHEA